MKEDERHFRGILLIGFIGDLLDDFLKKNPGSPSEADIEGIIRDGAARVMDRIGLMREAELVPTLDRRALAELLVVQLGLPNQQNLLDLLHVQVRDMIQRKRGGAGLSGPPIL